MRHENLNDMTFGWVFPIITLPFPFILLHYVCRMFFCNLVAPKSQWYDFRMGFPNYNFAFATHFSFYTTENIFARKTGCFMKSKFYEIKVAYILYPPIPSWSWVMLIELPVGKDYASLWPIILWWYGDNAMLTLERVTLVSIGVMVDDRSPFCMSNLLEKVHIATRSRVKI